MSSTIEVKSQRATEPSCIPSNYARLVARELGLQIRDLPKLLWLTELTPAAFMQEDTLLTAQQQVQIFQNGLQLANDECFSLRLAQRLTPSTHGAMGFLANSSPNFLVALQAFQSYVPTRMNFARLDLVSNEDHWECRCYFDLPLSADIYRMLSEVFATIFFASGEFIVGRPLTEANVYFTHSKPDYSDRYAGYLPGGLVFSSSCLMAKVPKSVCEIPNASANHENYVLALRQCEAMLEKLLSNKQSSEYQIQKMMLSHPAGMLNEEGAAAALFVSKRTLARRLSSEGTSFRKIRDQILSQQASDYLRETDMSIEAISALLNYHDSANFRRAFKRWFQLSPDQYRLTNR